MDKSKAKYAGKIRRKHRVRAKISGTVESPRFSVFRSNKEIYIQLIDDAAGKTLASASTKGINTDKKSEKGLGAKEQESFLAGQAMAMIAKEKNINQVVFDRNGNKYHGRVKAAAEGAREGGLLF